MSFRPALRGATLRGFALLAAATVVVTGCGSDAEPEAGAGNGNGGETAGSSDEFPVTVETAFGDVTIEEEPQRVVALGWGDAETALALGVEPIGTSDWLGFGGEGVGPWLEGEYDEAPELIETLEPSYEAIAALEPDLILDTKGPGTEERHEALSQIAPTVSQPEGVGPYQIGWERQLEMVGRALGRTDQAEELATEVEEAFTTAREEHPEFEGTEVAVGAYTAEGWGAYVRGDARVDFMETLGFVNKPEIQELAGENFYVDISDEQLGLLDAPLTVVFPIFVDASEITSNPLWETLDSVQQGNAVVLEDSDLLNAFSSGTAPGILYAIDNAVPMFADALA